eukprot:SAG31_NODE_3_length_45830_cov_42.279701_35_plen_59_part_00
MLQYLHHIWIRRIVVSDVDGSHISSMRGDAITKTTSDCLIQNRVLELSVVHLLVQNIW